MTSEVFDHTSVGRFIEQRFDVTIPAISPWHRAVCGDLTSAFDFEHPNGRRFPTLPDVSNYAQIEAVSKTLPPRRAAGHTAAALSADRHALVARAPVRAERRRAQISKADASSSSSSTRETGRRVPRLRQAASRSHSSSLHRGGRQDAH